VPALIADLGEEAAWRSVKFFTANIRNPNTRRAYARACNQFFAWCAGRRLDAYLTNGGALEHAQEMAAHEKPAHDEALRPHQGAITQDEVEPIRL